MIEHIKTLLEFTPTIREHADFSPLSDVGEVRAVTFSLPPLFDKEYETFAYIGFPKTDAKKVPAVVLVHGALGHAHHDWVRLWNARGYAAIAMDMEGCYPEEKDMREVPVDGKIPFVHGAYGPFLREGLADSPKNDAMNSMDKPLEAQWMFHCIAKAILAHNILLSDERVDKVGICGISWGSIITSLTIGYDPRFDFAISIYGGGYMLQNQGFCGDNFREAGVSGDTYLAEKRFANVKMPTLFLCSSEDTAFSYDANSLSYQAVKKGNKDTRFSIVEGFRHGQDAATHRIEPYIFADSVCKDKPALMGFLEEPQGREVHVRATGEVLEAKAFYLTKPLTFGTREGAVGNYPTESTTEVPCVYQNGIVSCTLPADARFYYITLCGERDGNMYFISSALTECK